VLAPVGGLAVALSVGVQMEGVALAAGRRDKREVRRNGINVVPIAVAKKRIFVRD
jgi:hypothetical protein